MLTTIEAEILFQHAIGAGSLWILRDRAAVDPSYDLEGLTALDERIEAHVDALRLAGDAGWDVCEEQVAEGEAGEVFAATLLAVERQDLPNIAYLLDVAGASPALSRGIVSALGWASFEHVEQILPGLFDDRCPAALQHLGVAACAAHRRDPGHALGHAAVSKDPRLRARALRAAGQLGRADMIPELRLALRDEDDGARFFAAWSGAVLGDPASTEALSRVCFEDQARAASACDTVVRRLDPPAATSLIRTLASTPEGIRAALGGAGALGDPALVPWIIEQMKKPEAARAAGAALTMITGVDLAAQKLGSTRAPEGAPAGPSDDPEEDDVALDPDEGLLWPEASAVERWWSHESARLARGTRHLRGQAMSSLAWLTTVLREGSQPERAAAALEIGIRQRQALFEVRAPGARQRRELASA